MPVQSHWDCLCARSKSEELCPGGLDTHTLSKILPTQAAAWGDGTMGHTFLKAAYREFTDDTFATRAEQRNPSDGIAGPTLRGEVGDVITVVFLVGQPNLL